MVSSGVLIANKPLGITSHDVVYKIRKAFGVKIGHTGTLDPLATGVLPLLINEGTKISSYLTLEDKSYRFTMEFGKTTSTLDSEGEVTKSNDIPYMTTDDISSIINKFIGEQTQIPPMFSAIKKDGIPLYKLARKGKTTTRKPRNINIYDLTLVKWETPFLTLDVKCSKGTYIRQLASDIGEKAGCGAYVTALQRTSSGNFSIDKSVTLENILKFTPFEFNDHLISLTDSVTFMDKFEITPENALNLFHGKLILNQLFKPEQGKRILLLDDAKNLLAIGESREEFIKPVKIFPENVKNFVSINNLLTNHNQNKQEM